MTNAYTENGITYAQGDTPNERVITAGDAGCRVYVDPNQPMRNLPTVKLGGEVIIAGRILAAWGPDGAQFEQGGTLREERHAARFSAA